jgi:hypothetical protein
VRRQLQQRAVAEQRHHLIAAPIRASSTGGVAPPRDSSSATPAFGSPALMAGEMHVEHARHPIRRKFDLVLNISRMDPSVA